METTLVPVDLITEEKSSRKIYLLLGYKCNEQCLFCGLGEDKSVLWPLYNEKMYETEEILKKVDELLDNGLSEKDAFEISGGEPTIHKDIIKILNYLRVRFSGTIFLFSNGLRFANETFTKEYLKTGVTNTIITLHSANPENHDKIAGLKNSFHKTLKGIKLLHDAGHPVSIKFIVNKMNYLDVQEWAQLVSENFPKARIMINGLAIWGQSRVNIDTLFVDHFETSKHISEAIDILVSKGIHPGLYFMPACAFDPYYWQYFGYRHYLESVLEANEAGVEMKSISYANCYNMPEKCNNCLMQPRCTWAWKPYSTITPLNKLKPVIAFQEV